MVSNNTKSFIVKWIFFYEHDDFDIDAKRIISCEVFFLFLEWISERLTYVYIIVSKKCGKFPAKLPRIRFQTGDKFSTLIE